MCSEAGHHVCKHQVAVPFYLGSRRLSDGVEEQVLWFDLASNKHCCGMCTKLSSRKHDLSSAYSHDIITVVNFLLSTCAFQYTYSITTI